MKRYPAILLLYCPYIETSRKHTKRVSKKYPDIAVVSKLKSGKEADLWLVQIKKDLFALKVYSGESLSTHDDYTQGQWISQPSLRKAVRQKNKGWKVLTTTTLD